MSDLVILQDPVALEVAKHLAVAHFCEDPWPDPLDPAVKAMLNGPPEAWRHGFIANFMAALANGRRNGLPTYSTALKAAMIDVGTLDPKSFEDEKLFKELTEGFVSYENAASDAKVLLAKDAVERTRNALMSLSADIKDRPEHLALQIRATEAELTAAKKMLALSQNGHARVPMAWSLSMARAYIEPPDQHLFLPCYVSKGQFSAMVGPPGVGKSRLMVYKAVCQILSRKWCGLTPAQGPKKWLYLGNENSVSRMKHDLNRMTAGLSEEEEVLVEEFFRFHAVNSYESGIIHLDEPAARDRVERELEEVRPDAVILDPLDSFSRLSLSTPDGMEGTLDLLKEVIHGHRHDLFSIIIHHAATSRERLKQSTGNYDALSYALGGKSLAARCRFLMNVMPGDEVDDKKLVLACAKLNDGEKFATRGLIMDPETCHYGIDPEFDLETWKADVDGTRKGVTCTIRDVYDAVAGGTRTSAEIIKTLKDAYGYSPATVKRRLKEAREHGCLQTGGGTGRWNLGKPL